MHKNYSKFYRQFKYSRPSGVRKTKVKFDSVSERYIQILALMFFVGVFLILIYGMKTIASWRVISWVYIIFAIVFSQLPTRWLPKVFNIRKELKILLAICALAPFFTGLLLLVNFYVPISENIRTVKVTEFKFSYSENIIKVELDDKELNKHDEIRKFPLNTYNIKPDSAVYLIKKGVFGFDVVKDSKLK